MITTLAIARAIALCAIENSGLTGKFNFHIEDLSHNHAPYDGVVVFLAEDDTKCLHVYLNDDDLESAMWMVDATNLDTGEVDPVPLSPVTLQFGLDFLVADAWLCKSKHGHEFISTSVYEVRHGNMVGEILPLTHKPGGTLHAWLDPTTGDLATEATNGVMPARFTKPLYGAR